MTHKITHDIVNLCIELDEIASLAYTELSKLTDEPEIREFWQRMSEEEKTHVDFWQRVNLKSEESSMPQVFEDPESVKRELIQIKPKALHLLERCRKAGNISDAFLLAYRLEFYLLHPAFETLFHILRHIVKDPCPEDEYEMHINGFIEMFIKRGKVTPEMELLGETLQRMWKENKALATRSSTDSLTGLLTRRAFSEIVLHLAYIAQRQKSKVGVMMVDLDHFKQINDTKGHVVGDRVLSSVAKIVTSNIRASDAAGRYGGDEFVVFMLDIDAKGSHLVAERIRKLVKAAKPEGVDTKISIGLVVGTIEKSSEHFLLKFIEKADYCLYQAKKAGGNRVVLNKLD